MTTSFRRIIDGLAAAALFALPAACNYAQHGMTPCPTEDAPGPCYWDAAQMGNEAGYSFTVTADQDVIYWATE